MKQLGTTAVITFGVCGGKETDDDTKAVVTTTAKGATKVKTDASKGTAVTKTAVKRQATLTDMFSGSGGSQPSTKKLKLHKSGKPGASTAASSGPRTLNQIPFSPSEFVASLSDDQKRLLALECESMGKSWYVTPPSVQVCHLRAC